MSCPKISDKCPHPVIRDNELILVVMPDENSDPVFSTIKQAVENIDGKNYRCERSDDKNTDFSIWCKKVCGKIRKADYLIVDITGMNPMVFYQLGFFYAIENKQIIIIDQNTDKAHSDISGIHYIEYSKKNLPALGQNIKNSITSIQQTDLIDNYPEKNCEDFILELKSELKVGEKRSAEIRKELLKSESGNKKLSEYIHEIELIQKNPRKQVLNTIVNFEGEIAVLKAKLNHTGKYEQEDITWLKKNLKETDKKLRVIKERYCGYSKIKDENRLKDVLIDEVKKHYQSTCWLRKAYSEQNPDIKIKFFSKAIQMDPDNATAYNNRGNSYAKLGQYDKSIQDHNKAIELDPDDARTYRNRGNVYAELEQYRNAVGDFNKAIELDPGYAKAYSNRGNAFTGLEQYHKAVRDYNKAIELDPGYARAYSNRGNHYFKLSQYKKAIKDYNKAIELDTDNAKTYSNRGDAYSCLEQYYEAIKDYNKAIGLDRNYTKAYYNRGNAFTGLEQYHKAVRDYNKAIELDPDYVPAYINRGNVYFKIGEYNKALKDCSKAIASDPDHTQALINRAKIYTRMKQYENSIEDYKKVIKLNPNDVNAYLLLSQVKLVASIYLKALDFILHIYNLPATENQLALCLYFECIIRKILNDDTSECEQKFKVLTEKDLCISWDFGHMEHWLENVNFGKEIKNFISGKTNSLKKHSV